MLLPLVAPVGVAPVGAAEAFTLTVEGGELRLRDTEEAQILESPTTIAGTNDGGVLTDGTFSTPPINFVLEVTSPVNTTADIEAVFTQASPVIGTIDPDGNVVLTLQLTVDLGIYVEILRFAYDCAVPAITLTLRSEAPYDGSGVLSGGFSIPSTPETGACPGMISDAVNDALTGGGHSLRLPVTGELTPPARPGEPTATSLVVSPGRSDMGDPVSLTATVVKDEGAENTDPITGGVDFLDRGQLVGSADLDEDGKATLVISTLGAGERRLQARYRGVPEIWASSTSSLVEHRVDAMPFLSTTLPASVRAGGAPVDFSVTVDNTTLGSALEDVRVDVFIQRAQGLQPITPVGDVPRIELSQVDGDAVTPVTLDGSGVLSGTIGAPGGWALAPGGSRIEHLRLAVSNQTDHGPLAVEFRLVKVTPGTGAEVVDTLASGEAQITVTEASRRPTTIYAGDDFFGSPAVTPVIARQGTYINLNLMYVTGGSSVINLTGTFHFFIDGRPVRARQFIETANPPLQLAVSASGQLRGYLVEVPLDVPTGSRQVQVRYSGDLLYAPSDASWSFQVAPAAGAVYECVWGGAAPATRDIVNVQATAALPSVAAAGAPIPITDMEVRLLVPRTTSGDQGTYGGSIVPTYEPEISFSLPGTGEVTSSSASHANGAPMDFNDGLGIDHVVQFSEASGIVVPPGAPGETTDIGLESIDATFVGSPANSMISCEPVHEALSLGQITLAGTALTADTEVAEPGAPVTLSATALPAGAGAVEFRDGTTSIGVVPTTDGTAVHLADELTPGTHELTATFHGGVGVPKTTSEPVTVRVATCAAATGEGNEAAVRLMYLEILRRCPDAAGLAYWVERLDAGATTREQITVQLASSLEARRIYVDDAYRQMLGRPAEAAGRNFWAPRLATGRYDVLLGDLAASAEFRSLAGGTDAGVVQRIYERIIGRAAEPAGVTYWTTYMRTHGVSRLVQVLYNLPEPLAATVRNAYQGLIGRNPTSQEATAGANLLASTGNRGRLDGAIIATDEFDTRAQGIPELT